MEKNTNAVTRFLTLFLSLLLFLALSLSFTIRTASAEWELRKDTGDSLNAVIYANDSFLTVGLNGTVFSSADGDIWIEEHNGNEGDWNDNLNGLAFGNGVYVAVGAIGAILTSADGDIWTRQSSSCDHNLNAVTWANNKFAAVGDFGAILTSPNGINWTSQNSNTTNDLRGVTYANNTFVAVGAGGVILTSSDGASWVNRTSGVSADLEDVTFGNCIFVAGGKAVLTSPDGVTWTPAPMGNIYAYSIGFGDGLFVMAEYGGGVRISVDAIQWNIIDHPPTYCLYGVAFGQDTFVIVGNYGYILQGYGDLFSLRLSTIIFSDDFEGESFGLGFANFSKTNSDKHGGSYSVMSNASFGWISYGPFSLADATSARLQFYYKFKSPPYGNPMFSYTVSKDNRNFYGIFSRESKTNWTFASLDLSNVPDLGDLRGQPNVFISIGVSGTSYLSPAYVDDLYITKDINCTFSINPESKAFTAVGGTDSVTVDASSASCPWTAAKSPCLSWVKITGATSGTGDGTVTYNVDPNTTCSSRFGDIIIAGKTITVTQACLEDVDNDGDSYSECEMDCNDDDATIYPGAIEICGDGIDQDCNGSDLTCTPDNDYYEEYYLANNADVARAVKTGVFGTGWEHFKAHGKAEGRHYNKPDGYEDFSEQYYLARNPDVARAVEAGIFGTGWDHFSACGSGEGRGYAKPDTYGDFNETYYLARNPDVARAVEKGIFGTGWDHFSACGKNEGRIYTKPVGYGDFSEEYYLAQNPDVARAVETGTFGTGWDHFSACGESEGRSYAKPNDYEGVAYGALN